eukprot:4622927-Pleurochrysis_carterae.AAC.4
MSLRQAWALQGGGAEGGWGDRKARTCTNRSCNEELAIQIRLSTSDDLPSHRLLLPYLIAFLLNPKYTRWQLFSAT